MESCGIWNNCCYILCAGYPYIPMMNRGVHQFIISQGFTWSEWSTCLGTAEDLAKSYGCVRSWTSETSNGKKGADNFNGGRIWRDSLPNMDGKGKISCTGSTWLAVELFSIWSSIMFQIRIKKYRTFIYGPCFNHSYVSLSQNLLLYIDTSNVWVCHVWCSCLGYDSFQIPGSLDLRCSNGPFRK